MAEGFIDRVEEIVLRLGEYVAEAGFDLDSKSPSLAAAAIRPPTVIASHLQASLAHLQHRLPRWRLQLQRLHRTDYSGIRRNR